MTKLTAKRRTRVWTQRVLVAAALGVLAAMAVLVRLMEHSRPVPTATHSLTDLAPEARPHLPVMPEARAPDGAADDTASGPRPVPPDLPDPSQPPQYTQPLATHDRDAPAPDPFRAPPVAVDIYRGGVRVDTD